MSDIGVNDPDVIPMASFRDLESVVFRETGILLIPVRFFECSSHFFVIHIGKTFKKE
jgi:hypothetical protein